jgi:hypothetical protein
VKTTIKVMHLDENHDGDRVVTIVYDYGAGGRHAFAELVDEDTVDTVVDDAVSHHTYVLHTQGLEFKDGLLVNNQDCDQCEAQVFSVIDGQDGIERYLKALS